SRATGYGIIERHVRGIRYVECGVIAPTATSTLDRRLHEIFRGLEELILELQPEVAAIESVFHKVFPQAAIVLGHARGVAMLAAARAGLRVFEYPPATVKRAIAGNGRATKTHLSALVRAACSL